MRERELDRPSRALRAGGEPPSWSLRVGAGVFMRGGGAEQTAGTPEKQAEWLWGQRRTWDISSLRHKVST